MRQNPISLHAIDRFFGHFPRQWKNVSMNVANLELKSIMIPSKSLSNCLEELHHTGVNSGFVSSQGIPYSLVTKYDYEMCFCGGGGWGMNTHQRHTHALSE